jgi:hypothetical protein
MSNVLLFKRDNQTTSAVFLDTVIFSDHFRYRVFLGNSGVKIGTGGWSGHDYEDALDMARGLATDCGLSVVHRVLS